ncbi:MAG: hypothetical protein WAQ24_01225 [Candidatus Saccharimonadales bacterium]
MKASLEGDYLVIQPEGLEKLWSLCGGLRVPRAAVTNARWEERATFTAKEIGLRVGTGFPGVLVAGWFFSKVCGKSFLFLTRPTYRWRKMELEAAHVLSLTLTNFSCDTIRLTVHDKLLADSILRWAKV